METKRSVSPIGGRTMAGGGGGGFGVQGANLGGRIMLDQQMRSHKRTLKAIRPIIDLSPPWSPQGRGKSPKKEKREKDVLKEKRMMRSRKKGSRSPLPDRSAAGSRLRHADSPAVIEALSSHFEEGPFKNFVAWLSGLDVSEKEMQIMVEKARRDAVERKLLQDFDGALPEEKVGQEEGKQTTSTMTPT
eukprot:TRINITY_DN600_c0_g1_i1.p1 TRINITY_DN600_c0_g1~~TRINITY_DN600_c0_g1_i1.p1  ORF type:complete len:208 (-),score=70.60 TRINITY_DN600_c0_g1_i1:760-1326(-)